MGEHKHNPVAKYFMEHPVARHLPLSFKRCERKPIATPVKLPEGRYIVKNKYRSFDPLYEFTCDHCGENVFMGNKNEEDY
jgi:hypothetical protein